MGEICQLFLGESHTSTNEHSSSRAEESKQRSSIHHDRYRLASLALSLSRPQAATARGAPHLAGGCTA